jgi:hypothetical protein
MNGLTALRRFLQKPPEPERCDLCSAPLPAQHRHLIEPDTRRILCACDACALLFPGTNQTKYLCIPRDVFYLDSFHLTDQLWNSLAIPIGLAFIFRSRRSGNVMAVYPSPAGCTESPLDVESWSEIVAENPLLKSIEPDVQALLANRIEGTRDYFIAPIDECYRLTGLIRQHWRGFSGGPEGWDHVRRFFDTLKQRAISYAGSHV